jgi:hypothetical protein
MVIVISMAYTGFSQEIPRHVFCSGGDNYETAAVQLAWTIGQAEPEATTYQPIVILCSGFQQLDDQLVSVKEIEGNHEILLYPNPCQDFVRLNASFEQSTTIRYTLYDFSGKAILSQELSGYSSYRETIELGSLPPGIYNLMLRIGSGNTNELKSFKLIRN